MTEYNGMIDAPPPVEIVERFSKKLAAVVAEHAAMPCDKTATAIVPVLATDPKMTHEAISGAIGERRARIGALLAELDREFGGLAEDLGVQRWRTNPVIGYKSAALSLMRRQTTMTAAQLLADLADINWSPGGFANANRPRHQITTQDFTRQGIGLYDRDLVGAQNPASMPDIDMKVNARVQRSPTIPTGRAIKR